MSIFKKINRDDISITPYTAHKKYTVLLVDFSASKQKHKETYHVFGYEGVHQHAFIKDQITGRLMRKNEFNSGSEALTTNDYPKRSIHDNLRHMYYTDPSAYNADKSFCVEPTRNEFRELNSEAQVISIPQQFFGDKIFESTRFNQSIIIDSGSKRIKDDGYGNLYDTEAGNRSDAIGLYKTISGSVVFKAGFNEYYPYHQDHVAPHCPAFPIVLKDHSRWDTYTQGNSIFFNSKSLHGTGIMLTGQQGNLYDSTAFSYMTAKNHDNIDFRKNEEFAISFWCNLPPSQSNTDWIHNYIVTKGEGAHYDSATDSNWISRFPFDISVYNQRTITKEGFTLNLGSMQVGQTAATNSLYVRNAATHSFGTASFDADLSGSYAQVQQYNYHTHTDWHGAKEASSSFKIGINESNHVNIVITGSRFPGTQASVSMKLGDGSILTEGTHSTLRFISSNGTSKTYLMSQSSTYWNGSSYATYENGQIVSSSKILVHVPYDGGATATQNRNRFRDKLVAAISGAVGHNTGSGGISASLTTLSPELTINNGTAGIMYLFQTLHGANGNTSITRTISTHSGVGNITAVGNTNFISRFTSSFAGGQTFTGGVVPPANTADTIFVLSGSALTNNTNKEALTKNIILHINNSSSHANYQAKIGPLSASYVAHSTLRLHSMTSGSQLSDGRYVYPITHNGGYKGNEYFFSNTSSATTTSAVYGTSSLFGGGFGGGGTHIQSGPSESCYFDITDTRGTSVRFLITTASIDGGSGSYLHQSTYPTISLHGGVTASALSMSQAITKRINEGMTYAWTASGNEFPLMIHADEPIAVQGSISQSYGATIRLTQSLQGTYGNRANALYTGSIVASCDNIFDTVTKDFGGANGPEKYSDHFTASWFVLTTRGPELGGPDPYQDSTESYERHLFYWQDEGPSRQPDLGLFTTHSSTMIDLSSSVYVSSSYHGTIKKAVMSGSQDIVRVLSASWREIENHPSFSVINDENSVPFLTHDTNPASALGDLTRFYGYSNGTVSSSWYVFSASAYTSDMADSNKRMGLKAVSVRHGNPPTMESGAFDGSGNLYYTYGPLFSSSAQTTSIYDTQTTHRNMISMVQTDGIRGIPGQILARRNDGHKTYAVSSSTMVTESWNHVLYQKSGSYLQLYVNGYKECEVTQSDRGECKNDSDYYFGVATRMTWSGNYLNANDGSYLINPNTGNPAREMLREYMMPVSGAFDEFQIHDRALNDDEIKFLWHCPNGTPFVGNAFYEHGLLTITHPSSAYDDIAKHCTMSFKNNFTITENEYSLNLKRGEYNFTMNPSILEKTPTGSRQRKIAPFVSETEWQPYITTVGLYNEEGQLLVVGKLSKPLQKNKGFDTTIVVQFDT